MPADLPRWAIDEERWADWCLARGLDESDESFALFQAWLEGDPADFIDPDAGRDERGADFGDVFVPDEREPF